MAKKTQWIFLVGTILVLSFALAACGSSSSSSAPAGEAATGQQTFAALPCSGCHGDNAEGAVGPKLAGYSAGWDEFQRIVRQGEDAMPKFTTDVVSDQQLADMYAWFTSSK